MTPGSSSACRLSLLGCLLAAAAVLALSACGSDGAATAETAASTQPERQAKVTVAVRPCPSQVGAFLKALDALRRQLAVGLSYAQYAARIEKLRSGYDGISVDRLTIGCLSSTGTPGEKALDEYIGAANAWGECLADASCGTAAIEPALQRKWRVASHFLAEAQ